MSDPSSRPEIALIGAQRPTVIEALERAFTCHHVYAASDPLAALQNLADRNLLE